MGSQSSKDVSGGLSESTAERPADDALRRSGKQRLFRELGKVLVMLGRPEQTVQVKAAVAILAHHARQTAAGIAGVIAVTWG